MLKKSFLNVFAMSCLLLFSVGSAWAEQKSEDGSDSEQVINYIRSCITDAQMQTESGKKHPKKCRIKDIGLPIPEGLDSVQFIKSSSTYGVTAVAKFKDGRLFVLEDSQLLEASPPDDSSKAATAAKAKKVFHCRSDRHITVCSNGEYGCVWSNRSGRLLGCGDGIQ